MQVEKLNTVSTEVQILQIINGLGGGGGVGMVLKTFHRINPSIKVITSVSVIGLTLDKNLYSFLTLLL